MARKIVVTSGKGGVGKTTVTAGVGAALARLGAKVVVMDTDIGLNNLDVVLGVESKIVYDLLDVAENRCRPRQALIPAGNLENFFILPSGHSYNKANLSGQNIKCVVESLSNTFDYILLDCPAGIEAGFHRAVAAADEAIIVTTPHISAIRDADKVFSLLKNYDLVSEKLIINRARGDLMLSNDMFKPDEIIDLLKIELVGIIPEDDEIAASSSLGNLPDKKSKVGKAIDFLALQLHTGGGKLWDCTKEYKGMFGGLKRKLRRIV